MEWHGCIPIKPLHIWPMSHILSLEGYNKAKSPFFEERRQIKLIKPQEGCKEKRGDTNYQYKKWNKGHPTGLGQALKSKDARINFTPINMIS